MNNSLELLHSWLRQHLPNFDPTQLHALAGDASFRYYYRYQLTPDQCWLVMDASQEQASCPPFHAIAQALCQQQLRAPRIYQADLARGYLLIEDFGDELLLKMLTPSTADRLYKLAINTLVQLQQLSPNQVQHPLAAFDTTFMQQELLNFKLWVIDNFLQLPISTAEQQVLTQSFNLLTNNASNERQVCIHRDYHSRNLLVLPEPAIGLIDFQDMMIGPLSYDLVSLIRDCYIDWPVEQVEQWIAYFYQHAGNAQLRQQKSLVAFHRDVDWMGCQRHLKASFIFARKFLRDNNPNYLEYLPRTFNYLLQVSARYSELSDFYELLIEKCYPALLTALAPLTTD